MTENPQYQISVHSISQLDTFTYDHTFNQVLILTADPVNDVAIKTSSVRRVRANLNLIARKFQVTYYVFLSSGDRFEPESLLNEIKNYLTNPTCEIVLLVPYLSPPIENSRTDNAVQSFIITKSAFDRRAFSLINQVRFIYHTVNFHLNSAESRNIEIIQVGKPIRFSGANQTPAPEKLNDSSVQITHKGPLKLLKRCLAHLDGTPSLPQKIEICFDDYSFKKLDFKQFKHIADKTICYQNSPIGVGPFLAREYMVKQSDKEYIYLLDSDDIAVPSRFDRLMRELEQRKLDLLGSHELRIDQINKQLAVVRFPLNVNYALARQSFHPMLHGTCIMTKTGFLKVGGYSTEGRFGYDTQFLLRAGFFLKVGNMDDFLYLRFQRPHSLTTAKKTKFGTKMRKFMAWRWRVDFNLVSSNKLDLADSSLLERKHNFPFNIVRITK